MKHLTFLLSIPLSVVLLSACADLAEKSNAAKSSTTNRALYQEPLDGLEFGQVEVLKSKTLAVHLTNISGSSVAKLVEFLLPEGFSVDRDTCGNEIGLSSTCQIKITFSPKRVGIHSGTATYTFIKRGKLTARPIGGGMLQAEGVQSLQNAEEMESSSDDSENEQESSE